MRFQDTRFTGANRCWPCSILNAGLAAVVAGALAVVGRPALAAGTAVVSVAAIWLKGYLVPGTPRLTRHLPEPVLAAFGKSGGPVDLAGADLPTALRAAGALTDDLRLDPGVREAVAASARTYVDDDEALREALLATYPEAVEVSSGRSLGGGEHWHVRDDDGMTVAGWEARATAALDAAAATALSERLPSWGDRPLDERASVLALARHDAESCPVCEGSFETRDGPRVVCCGGRSLAGDRRCADCGYALVDRSELPDEGELTAGGSPDD